MKWIKLSDLYPPENKRVLISDGTFVAVVRGFTRYSHKTFWDPEGLGGYEWEWDSEPTHWAEFDIELPEVL